MWHGAGYPTIKIELDSDNFSYQYGWFKLGTLQERRDIANMCCELYGDDCYIGGDLEPAVVYIKYNPSMSYHWLSDNLPKFVFNVIPAIIDDGYCDVQSSERTNTLNAKFYNFISNKYDDEINVDDSIKANYPTKLKYVNDLHDFMGQHLYSEEDLKMQPESSYENEAYIKECEKAADELEIIL